MKLLLTTLLIGYLFQCKVNAKIINGYAPALKVAERSIRNLEKIDINKFSKEKKAFYNSRVKAAEKKLRQIVLFYRKTDDLIHALNIIHPVLYLQIDTINDKEGNVTDVYIKAVDPSFFKGKFWGTTNLNQSQENPNIYTSGYGDKTVCVSVVYKCFDQALIYLIHELGHVKYQVPHLAEYVIYFNKVYNNRYFGSKNLVIGHAPTDPSHRSVKETQKEFNKFLTAYNKSKKENKDIAKNKVHDYF